MTTYLCGCIRAAPASAPDAPQHRDTLPRRQAEMWTTHTAKGDPSTPSVIRGRSARPGTTCAHDPLRLPAASHEKQPARHRIILR